MIPGSARPDDRNIWLYLGPQASELCIRAQLRGKQAFSIPEDSSPNLIRRTFEGLGAVILDTGADPLFVAAAAERLTRQGASPVVSVDYHSGKILAFDEHAST